MIYLITGTPGAGKTALLCKMMLENKEGLFTFDDGSPRQIFTCNIPWTKAGREKFGVADVSAEQVKAASIHDNFPEGSVLIVDEASEVYPARAMSAKLPVHVEGLNTLRHNGYTLILLTQFPHMIDPFVRQLVFKHWHLKHNQIGEKLYEFLGCQTSFGRGVLQMGVGEFYKPDPKVFDLYESATRHIKVKKKKGWQWYLLPTMPLLIGGALWLMSAQFGEMEEGAKAKASENVAAVERKAAAPATPATEKADGAAKETAASAVSADDWLPRVAEREETAPIYDGVRKVEDFPQVVGCISSSKGCNCYTQQGTRARMTAQACRDWLEDRPFDPYRQRLGERQAEAVEQTAGETQSPSVFALTGHDKYLPSPKFGDGPAAQ